MQKKVSFMEFHSRLIHFSWKKSEMEIVFHNIKYPYKWIDVLLWIKKMHLLIKSCGLIRIKLVE